MLIASGTFSALVMTPKQPAAGSPVNLLGSGTLSKSVTGGSGSLNVLFDSVPLYQGVFATCGNTTIALPLGVGSVQVNALACPTVAGAAGSLQLNVTVLVPVGVPSGSYEVTLLALDQASAPAYCADAKFALSAAAPALRGAAATVQ